MKCQLVSCEAGMWRLPPRVRHAGPRPVLGETEGFDRIISAPKAKLYGHCSIIVAVGSITTVRELA